MAGGSGYDSGSSGGSRATAGRPSARVKKSGSVSQGLMLASMLDILMSILFFLLKNYSSSVTDFNLGQNISLPESTAIVSPVPALQLVITQNAILLDNETVATIVNGEVSPKDMERDGVTIRPLMIAFKKQKDKTLFIEKQNDARSFTGTIIMQADKGMKFNVIKKVLYTAGMSDFVMLKVAALKKDET